MQARLYGTTRLSQLDLARSRLTAQLFDSLVSMFSCSLSLSSPLLVRRPLPKVEEIAMPTVPGPCVAERTVAVTARGDCER